ncbi:putative malate transporter yflS [Tetrabaena socialis]|uniref:Putative malate transporter yflS n=1 Tax=Tetrabaena socialis TaxID=47790 RepID=A0A2J7ZNX9_9CHLO|nr:putative malate transporter yflS [Tetrabaena socialis]|eukprot:PNH01975.1 putative malate transporter yflS [Tetrabaena socialis]
MGSTIEEIMRKRQREAAEAYESMWAGGQGSHHPDYDPEAPPGPGVVKADRPTEELYGAIVRNDVHQGDWLRLGFILSIFYLAVWLGIGGAWWKVIGLW